MSFFTTSLAIAVRPDGPVRTSPDRLRRHPRRGSHPARTAQLLLGLVAVGMGVGLLIRADLGVASWDVLHVGLSETTGWTVGMASAAVGLAAAGLAALLGERPRLGSLVPLAVIGPTIDATLLAVDPVAGPLGQARLLVEGVTLMALGVGAYIASDHGAGPSDLVFLALARHGLPLWAARLLIDGAAVLGGWLLGGPVGIGTIAVTAGLGPLISQTLRWFDLTPARSVIAAHERAFQHSLGNELQLEIAH